MTVKSWSHSIVISRTQRFEFHCNLHFGYPKFMYFVHDISNIFDCFNVGHASSFILVLISPSHRNGRNFRKLWRRWQVCLCSSIYRVHSWSSICIWGRQAYATSGNYIAVNRYLYFIDLVVNTTLF